jgi:hypothetical protein
MDAVWQELLSADGSEVAMAPAAKFLKFAPGVETVTASFMEVRGKRWYRRRGRGLV